MVPPNKINQISSAKAMAVVTLSKEKAKSVTAIKGIACQREANSGP